MKETKLQHLLEHAHFVAKKFHLGQTYAWQRSYYDSHILEVLEEVKRMMPVQMYSRKELYFAQIVAVLHDVLEDTDYTEEDMLERFGSEITTSVLAITKLGGESRKVYISRVKEDRLAALVKQSDAICNLRTSLMTKSPRLIQKYLDTLQLLSA